MPKITISDNKGLVVEGGSGVTVLSKGLNCCLVGSELALSAANDYDTDFNLPAGALIVDAGIRVTDAFTTDNNGSDVVNYNLGTNTGGTPYSNIIGAAAIAADNKTIAINTMQTVSAANKLEAGSAAIAFVDEAALYSATARTVRARVRVMNNALSANGAIQCWLIYPLV